MHWFKRLSQIGLLTVLTGLSSLQALANDYPQKPIKLVVPYPPGGGIDPSARVVADALAQELGQPIVVQNLSGASGRIGTASASRTKPDGYTILFGSVAPNSILPAAYGPQMGYDARKDFIPIGLVAQANYVLVVNSALPINSLQELIDYAKAHPKTLSYASSGFLSGPHLAGELLAKMAHIDLLHVPYQGTGPALVSVMSGETSMMFESEGNVVAKFKAGKYRVLAVSGTQPSAFPDAPNMAKLYPGHNVSQWYGLLAIAETPPAVIARLHEALAKAVRRADVKQLYGKMGLVVVQDSTPENFKVFIANEIDRWKDLIHTQDIAVPAI